MTDRVTDEIIGRAAFQRIQQDGKRAQQLLRRELEVKALQEELRQCAYRAGLERYWACRELVEALLKIFSEPWNGAFSQTSAKEP
ncbi:hypothetical protein CCYA_CCYA08G2460 [Cyanidiococcus yangmingshanensis]|nr:hypothetical protein CCYA_CCYA08G2460 [Cyanidiococcus yangmingshanensis]